MWRLFRRTNGFGGYAQGLIHPIDRPLTETPRKGPAGLTHQIFHPPKSKLVQRCNNMSLQSQGRHRQRRKGLAHKTRLGNTARCASIGAQLRRGASTLPIAAFDGARTSGWCLLINRITRAVHPQGLTCIARQGPCGAFCIRHADMHRKAKIKAILLHLLYNPFLTTKQMCTTCQINDQRMRQFFSHPGRKLRGPAAQTV